MSTVREVTVQVNGKNQEVVTVPPGTTDAELSAAVLKRPLVRATLAGRSPARVVLAAGGKIANVVAK